MFSTTRQHWWFPVGLTSNPSTGLIWQSAETIRRSPSCWWKWQRDILGCSEFGLHLLQSHSLSSLSLFVFLLFFLFLAHLDCLHPLKLAKVLSNRVRGVLHEVLSWKSVTFINDRNMLDCVKLERKNKREGRVIKLDLEKAYDEIDWDSRTSDGKKTL